MGSVAGSVGVALGHVGGAGRMVAGSAGALGSVLVMPVLVAIANLVRVVSGMIAARATAGLAPEPWVQGMH